MCGLDYIPPRLWWQNQKILTEFRVNDVLYRRCDPEELENPYLKISLVDLSHNIGTCDGNPISDKDDVLYSIRTDEEFKMYSNKEICQISIISLNAENGYDKEFHDELDTENNGRMRLDHEPLDCMYPHCVFRVWHNGTPVSFQNYKQTLGHKTAKRVRTKMKDELAKMIVRRELNQLSQPNQSTIGPRS